MGKKDKMKKFKRRTKEELAALISVIDKEVAEGKSIQTACEDNGYAASQYYARIKSLNNSPKPDEPQIIIHGDTQAIEAAPRGYNKRPKAQLTGKCIIMLTDVGSVAQLIRELI